MKLGFLSHLIEKSVCLTRRLFGRAESAGAGSFREAAETVRELQASSLSGSASTFERKARAVLDSPYADILAGGVARAAAKALEVQPDSTEIYNTLIRSHQQLEANIRYNKTQIRRTVDGRELTSLNVNIFNDARTLAKTKPFGMYSGSALHEMAVALDNIGLFSETGKRLVREVAADPELAEGVKNAARRIVAARTGPGQETISLFERPLRQRGGTEIGYEGILGNRNIDLGLFPPRVPIDPRAAENEPHITAQIQAMRPELPVEPVRKQPSPIEVYAAGLEKEESFQAAVRTRPEDPDIKVEEIPMQEFARMSGLSFPGPAKMSAVKPPVKPPNCTLH